MLSPHNSISKKFLLHFDYVYSISLVRGKMQSCSQCVSTWAVHRASNGLVCLVSAEEPLLCWATERTSVASQDQAGGSQWPLTEAQSPLAWQLCFPRANLTGVLKPRPAGKEEAGEQRCFLRHAGYMEGKGQAPFLSLALWVQNVALSSVP